MPTADVSSLPQGSPGPISAGKVWALWTDRCSSSEGKACHFHFNIFQGVMSGHGRLQHPWDWQLDTCCSLSNLVMLTILWDQVHLAYSFSPQKKHGFANLVITIHIPIPISSRERCSAGPCEIVRPFWSKSHCISVMWWWIVYQAIWFWFSFHSSLVCVVMM